MGYVQGTARDQMMVTSLDMMVDADSIVRVVDAFVDTLDLEQMGFSRPVPSHLGRPSYDPKMLLKIYVFGYHNSIRSSRKLALACRTNVEAMWLACGLEPDFRTIADFRKENAACLKAVFREFFRRVTSARKTGFYSVDGTKIRASNAKDLCFTASKLDDRIGHLEDRCEEYLRALDEADGMDADEAQARLDAALKRKGRYEGYRDALEQSGESQIALTDPDSRLMKARGGFDVCYNVQAAVESSTHLIADFEATSRPTDHGLLASTLADVKTQSDGIVECTADKGYICPDDMAECLLNGIVPHVIAPDGKDAFELEVPFDPAGGDPESTDPAQLAACLKAATVPDAYAPFIESAEVVEKSVPAEQDAVVPKSPYGTPGQMAFRASEGYFVRDPERNVVVCPAGELLRQKSVRADGKIRYANKLACRRCTHKEKCFSGKGKWKEVDFCKDGLEKPCRLWGGKTAASGRTRRKTQKVKVVRIVFRPDAAKTRQRMCLSEHPFGTVKRALGADHFLMRGKTKVEGEFALAALAYNIRRAMGMLGFEGLMEAVAPGFLASLRVYLCCTSLVFLKEA